MIGPEVIAKRYEGNAQPQAERCYALQRGPVKGFKGEWLSFDYAPDRKTAREFLKRARRLFPAYRWRIAITAECQERNAA